MQLAMNAEVCRLHYKDKWTNPSVNTESNQVQELLLSQLPHISVRLESIAHCHCQICGFPSIRFLILGSIVGYELYPFCFEGAFEAAKQLGNLFARAFIVGDSLTNWLSQGTGLESVKHRGPTRMNLMLLFFIFSFFLHLKFTNPKTEIFKILLLTC